VIDGSCQLAKGFGCSSCLAQVFGCGSCCAKGFDSSSCGATCDSILKCVWCACQVCAVAITAVIYCIVWLQDFGAFWFRAGVSIPPKVKHAPWRWRWWLYESFFALVLFVRCAHSRHAAEIRLPCFRCSAGAWGATIHATACNQCFRMCCCSSSNRCSTVLQPPAASQASGLTGGCLDMYAMSFVKVC
jgi:hypothetical protein